MLFRSPKQDPQHTLALRYSLPDWLIKMWIHQYGEQKTEEIAKASNASLPLSIRRNLIDTSEDEIRSLSVMELLQDPIYLYSGTPAGKQLDNFTDSLMLLTASHPNGENPWKDAIRVPQFRSNDMEPTQLLIDMFSGQETEKQEVSYGRYWHGYLIFLKPLLAVFSYSQIRDILSMVQIGLFMVIVLLLAKKEKYYHSIGMFLFWMVMNPIAGMLSLQYSSLLILTFIDRKSVV